MKHKEIMTKEKTEPRTNSKFIPQPLKFRLWHEQEKRMVYKGRLTFDLSDGAWLWEGRHGSFHSHFGACMLWAGYSDRKGVDIFEGDKLRLGEGTCVVIREEGRFIFSEPDNWLEEWNWADDCHRMLVTGNVYETK